MKEMSRQIDENKIDLVHKIDDIPRTAFSKVIPDKNYKRLDIENAADLIEKMLEWVPSNRISCAEALNHPFFR
jgi:serine/threonine protein kinase